MFNLQFSKRYLLLIILFFLAFLERTVFDLGPNMELITMSLVLSSLYIGRKEAFWLTFLLISITDRLIGNSNIFLFTWSGFIIPALFAGNIFDKNPDLSHSKISRFIFGTVAGLGTSLFFFLWTNLGVWALDSWGMYTNNFSGLIQSYINALPFFRTSLTSTLLFVPVGIFTYEIAGTISPLFSKYLRKFLPRNSHSLPV